jgi:hypothetical protein
MGLHLNKSRAHFLARPEWSSVSLHTFVENLARGYAWSCESIWVTQMTEVTQLKRLSLVESHFSVLD